MDDDLTTIDGVIALPVPVPPMLERALGYSDPAQGAPARLIGIFWEPAGDEARCSDGRRTADANWYAYQAYLDGLVRPQLALAEGDLWNLPYDFGSSEVPAQHWLLLDREQRRLYAAPVPVARQVLRSQWPTHLSVLDGGRQLMPEELLQVVRQGLSVTPPPSQAKLYAALATQDQAYRELLAWIATQQARN
jgi:hypothetical protein